MYRMLLVSQLLASATAQFSSDPQDATAFSLLYGYPLLAWQNYYQPILEDVGANTWSHARTPATSENTTIVKPNVDTLYSTIIYDLSASNLEITLPDVADDVFKLFSFYDPFGDNYANVGTGASEDYISGTYLLRPVNRPGGTETPGVQVINTFGSSSGYAASVNSPSVYGILLVRWGVTPDNADEIHGYQDDCEVDEQDSSEEIDPAPPELDDLVDAYSDSATPAENVMSLLAAFVPPLDAPTDSLEDAGISGTEYDPPSSVDLDEANSTAVSEAQGAAADPSNFVSLNNGWSVFSPDEIGIYGDNYALRTAVATSGYLALRNPFAIYPTWTNASADDPTAPLSIGADEAVLFTFSGKPPIDDTGFWSLTAYGDDNFLIPNDLDRYALGDESSLTYSDGTEIYDTDDNDTFQLLLQPADITPPSNWTSNWLPATAGGGDVIAQLRFYIAQDPLIDGSYDYPIVEKIAAITEGGSSSGGGDSGSGGDSTSGGGSSNSTGTGGGGGTTTTTTTSDSTPSGTSTSVSLTQITGGSAPTGGSSAGGTEDSGAEVLSSSLIAVLLCLGFTIGLNA